MPSSMFFRDAIYWHLSSIATENNETNVLKLKKLCPKYVEIRLYIYIYIYMNIFILLPVITSNSNIFSRKYMDLSSLDMNTPPLNINYVCFGPYLTPEIFSLLSRKLRQLNQIWDRNVTSWSQHAQKLQRPHLYKDGIVMKFTTRFSIRMFCKMASFYWNRPRGVHNGNKAMPLQTRYRWLSARWQWL